ncbi:MULTISPECIES: hypothetical protein [Moorena]|uniref:Uncharacterized protein n=1 Tax=Moorena producens 3L TaxID=489825 RepID=F4XIT2_9CYAN|nr:MULTISPECIES: hypothetical protein [Moorena]NEP49079.1 hypothetical protein [Moorena sp. SIO3C2]EGJ35594.1 hypothetical protein LYNGBM3L_03010 [Moorena producens 3L]NEP32772.1 hypothetical protein [Moorena sp. SIO3B2]NEP69130.1 hypothetical protein [Moorena sp. SIO3A5]NER91104.1 hypothetical protein [Moorena sp. SIO3A2]
MNLNDLIEEKLNYYAQKIVSGGSKTDEMAVGEITFYVALRRVVNGKGTLQDVGMMDAINDTLQSLGLVEEGKTFYK